MQTLKRIKAEKGGTPDLTLVLSRLEDSIIRGDDPAGCRLILAKERLWGTAGSDIQLKLAKLAQMAGETEGALKILTFINQVIKTEDFFFRKNSPKNYTDEKEMKANRPVEMKPAVCRAFIASYEEMMQRSINYPPLNKKINYRWLILNQVRGFGNFLEKSTKTYEPFVWEI